jgi:hypothetical protein
MLKHYRLPYYGKRLDERGVLCSKPLIDLFNSSAAQPVDFARHAANVSGILLLPCCFWISKRYAIIACPQKLDVRQQ